MKHKLIWLLFFFAVALTIAAVMRALDIPDRAIILGIIGVVLGFTASALGAQRK